VNALSPFLVGGAAARPDSLSGMRPEFAQALQTIFSAAPEDVRAAVQITSGYRSPEVQAQLYREAVEKYGSEQAARRWVAPPGRSRHNHGDAADLKFGSDAAREWFHQNAGEHGLAFPMSWEPWHVELAGARNGGPMARAGQAAGDATAQFGPVGAAAGVAANALADLPSRYSPDRARAAQQQPQAQAPRNALNVADFMAPTQQVQPMPFITDRYLTGGRRA
jgi:hypothetical protein